MQSASPKPFSAYRVLAVIAHPDDEAYSFAGTLALCADGGAAVLVASATRGEGPGTEGSRQERERKGRLRTLELQASCRAIGAMPPLFLDLPDGGLGRVDRSMALERFVGLFRKTRPDVVLTHGPDGAYGHLDHVAVSSLVTEGLSIQADRPMPRILHAAFPRNLFRPVWQRLRRSRRYRRTVLASRPDFGCSAEQVDLRIELASFAARKIESIRSHVSQLPEGDFGRFLFPGLLDRLLQEEWFRHAGGPPLPPEAKDIFAGFV